MQEWILRAMAFVSTLLVCCSGAVLISAAPADLDQLVGGDEGIELLDKCKDCNMEPFIKCECLHSERWDPCIGGACIENTAYYQKCIEKKKEEKANCELEFAHTVYLVQIAKKTTKPAPCGDVWQDFKLIPGWPKAKAPCINGVPRPAEGKCFIETKDCDGAKFLEHEYTMFMKVCKGKAKEPKEE